MPGSKTRKSDCHPERFHMARGMCSACYDRWLKSVNPAFKERHAAKRRKYGSDPATFLKRRSSILKRKYGITHEDYEIMRLRQNDRCFICSKVPTPNKRGYYKLWVDHCHVTGVVRSLLCVGCNNLVGYIGKSCSNMPKIKLN